MAATLRNRHGVSTMSINL